MFKEFKEFAIKGNALELAVGVVIGAAFSQIVNSLVNDILSPLLGLFTGHVDFSKLHLDFFHNTIRYGSFLNALIYFLIVSFAVFLVVKQINRFRHRAAEVPHIKPCPFCKTAIDKAATRCPACTSQLT